MYKRQADLLTKCLASREKLDQLIKLFGLVAMKGRAKSAPLLRRKKIADPIDDAVDMEEDMGVCVVDGLDESGVVLVPEAGRHDVDVWPHLHAEDLRERLFPTATSVPEMETIPEDVRDEHRRLHRRWAATRLTIARG